MTKHAAAVLGIGLISMGEEIGSEMAFRTFGHLVSSLMSVIKKSVRSEAGLDFVNS